MGSRQTAGSVPAPRVEAPSHGSHVTALIAFLAVTGREYHCPHCLSSPF
nr:MAG TPA: RNHCP domain protein [Caudoviricetes sp.]